MNPTDRIKAIIILIIGIIIGVVIYGFLVFITGLAQFILGSELINKVKSHLHLK